MVWSEEVVENTVCEFTGTYDKTNWSELSEEEKYNFCILVTNHKKPTDEDYERASFLWPGREIYENDIVEIDGHHKSFVVKYNNPTASFLLLGIDEEFDFTFIDTKHCRVIGNINDE